MFTINKRASGDPPAPGAVIRYEIEVRNNDVNPVYNIAVWDTLPPEVELINDYTGLPFSRSGNYIRWDLSSEPGGSPLSPGHALYLIIECRIKYLKEGLPVTNYAGCDYYDGAGKHAPVFSEAAFYPYNLPVVYPNPGVDHVRFTNIVPGSQIDLFTVSGELVDSISVVNIVETWDCKNRRNSRVSPGIYYYLIKNQKRKAFYKGKIFIVKTNY